MTLTGVREQATYLRAALLLGLATGDDVSRWAASQLEHQPEPSAALVDIALAPSRDVDALRAALRPLARRRESRPVLMAILQQTWRDLASGRRNLRDTVTVLSQARRALVLPPVMEEEIDTLEDAHILALAGVTGDLRECGERIRQWLARFDSPGQAIAG